MLVAGLTALICWKVLPPKINEVKVVEVQERVKTLTRIVVRPDGTTITTIEELRDTLRRERTERTVVKEKTHIALSRSSYRDGPHEPVYTLGVQREVMWGVSVGAYARTDKELGLTLGYSF